MKKKKKHCSATPSTAFAMSAAVAACRVVYRVRCCRHSERAGAMTWVGSDGWMDGWIQGRGAERLNGTSTASSLFGNQSQAVLTSGAGIGGGWGWGWGEKEEA